MRAFIYASICIFISVIFSFTYAIAKSESTINPCTNFGGTWKGTWKIKLSGEKIINTYGVVANNRLAADGESVLVNLMIDGNSTPVYFTGSCGRVRTAVVNLYAEPSINLGGHIIDNEMLLGGNSALGNIELMLYK